MDTETLKAVLFQGLTLAMSSATSASLGDRSEYIGASDASGCIRKAVLKKIDPSEMNTLAAKIRGQRGHVAETIITTAYAALGKNFDYQCELIPEDFPAPCRIHPDIILNAGSYLDVQEIKAVSVIPSQPYESWVRQNTLQQGALRQRHNDLPIKGRIIAVDLNSGQIKAFPIEYDLQLFERMKARVGMIWTFFQENRTDPLPTEKGPLCGWCGYAMGCPALQHPSSILDLPIRDQLMQILELREIINSSDRQLKSVSAIVQGIMEEQSLDIARGDDLVVRKSLRKRRNDIDKALLREEYPGVFETVRKETRYYQLDIAQV